MKIVILILLATFLFANSEFNKNLNLAKTHQTLGFHNKAKEILETLNPQTNREKSFLYIALADSYLSIKSVEKAQEYIKKAKDLNISDEVIKVSILNLSAKVDMIDGYFMDAKAKFKKALTLTKNENLKFTLLTNLLLTEIEINDKDKLKFAKEAFSEISKAKESVEKSQVLITFGILLKNSGDDEFFNLSFEVLKDALKIAKKFDDSKVKSLAYGYFAQVYEDNRQFSQALKLTKSAIFYAQEAYQLPEILYFWQWQLARLLNELKQKDEAIEVYKEAIKTLTPIKKEFFKGYRNFKDSFKESVKPVYIGLVELIIEKFEKSKNEKYLREAIEIMETLKNMELENIFSDECLLKYKSKIKSLTSPPKDTAILYPIALPNRVVKLIVFNDKITLSSFDINFIEFDNIVREFRQKLQTRVTKRFFYGAKKLYDILIRDIEPILKNKNIKTLLIAPDGVLRLIPFSTLYSGKKFLIEDYEIVTALSMQLTDLSKFKNRNFFVGGISEARQDFSALPNVLKELNEVKEIISAKEVIKNSNFTLANLIDNFKANDYSIVHIATHGVFMGEPKDSFLLAYNKKLTMEKLQNLLNLTKYKEGIELLTLSACQSALGDERSALGLAGVGLRAGAKSAIATLWFVDDEATSIGIRAFYKNLTIGDSKAKALQKAQIKLLKQKRYAHPSYWAPFLLIGNWL